MSVKKIIKQKFPALVPFSHKLRGVAAHHLYGRPSQKMKIIGVTGTNGKTTTCHLIASILESSGAKVGMATTTTFKVDNKIQINKTNMTTMSPFKLQALLRQMANAGCEYAIVETTTHAISQFRNYGITYFAVAMTNVTHDHLDYHGTFESYLAEKLKLFSNNPKLIVANLDDPNGLRFLSNPAGRHIGYSLESRGDVVSRKILIDEKGSTFTIVLPSVQVTVELKLPGMFNISNALCAASVATGLGISPEMIKNGLEDIKSVPGRMEKIEAGQDFTVIVDYAHTPDALQKVYSELTKILKGKLIAVLGACGDRDKSKRPIMGSLAAQFADIVIITDEEPYTEDPNEIIEQVALGVFSGKAKHEVKENENFFKVMDRRKAIAKALSVAQRNDIVIITGMGAQEFRVIGEKHLPWVEKKVVKQELERLGYNKR
jgi:UDP-N-acetylmuramoyl-L-alanyl-D-glutamate--2,6-diaminopimelate ligase